MAEVYPPVPYRPTDGDHDTLLSIDKARAAARLRASALLARVRLMLIAQLSDVHVGGPRYKRGAAAHGDRRDQRRRPDLVVVAGDLTDEGYPDQYPVAREELSALAGRRDRPRARQPRRAPCRLPPLRGHFGARDSRKRLECGGLDVALVAVDSTKPDLDEGEIGREHYGWIEEGFAGAADLRVFACHHHLMPIPGTGRERNQVLDAGDVLALLRRCEVDLVSRGHRHVPYVWPVAGMLLVHSGTVSTLRTRGFPHPAYNLIRIEAGRISVELCVPGGERQSLGDYPRDWPDELSARQADPFVRAQRGVTLADDS